MPPRMTRRDGDACRAEIQAESGWMRNGLGEIVARLEPLEQGVRPVRKRLALDH